MGVPQELQVLNLPFDTASHVPTDKFFTSNDFESNLLSGELVNGQPHFTKRSLAQGSHNLIGADALFGFGLVPQRLHGVLATGARLGGPGGIVATLVPGVMLRRLLLLLLLAPDVG